MAEAAVKTVPEGRRQAISFRLAGELYGFEIEHVDKVIEVPGFAFVPRAPGFTRGVVSHQGKVIAVVDLGQLFGRTPAELSVDSRVIILESETFNLGFLVDRVERIESVALRGEAVRPVGADEANPYVTRVINLGGRLFHYVDVGKLLAEIEEFFA